MGHPFKDTISLEEAIHRSEGPLAFNLMIKPAGSLCNLDCHYCYYLDKAEIYGGRQPRMSLEMLEKLTKEYIAANDVPEVTFNWHGGEPLVMGLDFYKKAVEFQKQYADGKIIHNTLQTNGTMITRETADFFAQNNFLLGISIDGPADIHDKFRKDKGGHPTFEKVIQGLLTLRHILLSKVSISQVVESHLILSLRLWSALQIAIVVLYRLAQVIQVVLYFA